MDVVIDDQISDIGNGNLTKVVENKMEIVDETAPGVHYSPTVNLSPLLVLIFALVLIMVCSFGAVMINKNSTRSSNIPHLLLEEEEPNRRNTSDDEVISITE